MVKKVYDKYAFDTYNNLSCYWGGFLAADGCVYDVKRIHPTWQNRLQLYVSRKDQEHLGRFIDFISYQGTLIEKNNGGYPLVGLDVSDDHLCGSLSSKFGIFPHKSLTLLPPPINQLDHQLAFIVGYLDGDGWICYENRVGAKPVIQVGVCGTYNLLYWMKGVLDGISKSETGSIRKKNKARSYEYRFGQRKALSLLRSVTNLGLPLMERKWQKLIEKATLTPAVV